MKTIKTKSRLDKNAVRSAVRRQKMIYAARHEARIFKTVHPTAAQLKRRKRYEKDLAKWLKYYMPDAFPEPFGDAHHLFLTEFQACMTQGGWIPLAMPRGSGKSTAGKGAMTWAVLSATCQYVVPIGATGDQATEYLDFAKGALTGDHPRISEDYPEVCGYFENLNGSGHRANFQLGDDGKPSGIGWRPKGLTFPRVRKENGVDFYEHSGAIIEVRGITAAMKGLVKKVGGKQIRPDLVIPDDVQTEDDAESPTTCDKIERKLIGTVSLLAGPNKRMACFMPCTCVRKDDVIDRFLDHEKHPECQGIRVPMLRKWPDAKDTLWQEYVAIRTNSDSAREGIKKATAFYKAHRAAMDAGAEVTWIHRKRPDEISAIQNAMNFLFELGPEKFHAEMQNAPLDADTLMFELTPDHVISRTDKERMPGVVPDWARVIVAATDVNPTYALTTEIKAFGQDQRCAVLWYGTHKMNVAYETPPAQKKAEIMMELEKHGRMLASLPCRPNLWGVDGGGAPLGTAIDFCASSVRTCGLEAVTLFGRATAQYYPKATDRKYEQVYQRAESRLSQWAIWNSDHWREVEKKSWLGAIGGPGSCDLPKGNHREYAEQLCCEQLRSKEEVKGKMVYTWKKSPGKNDYGDCAAMNFALAAMRGIGTGGQIVKKQPARRRRISYVG